MGKRRFVWPKARLLALDNALALVQCHSERPVSLMSPLLEPDQRLCGMSPDAYRDTVFFWLTDANCGVAWLASFAQQVQGDLAKMIARKLDYAAWRARNPERDCLDCTEPFLPAQGWAEAGYPPDVCPRCVGRRLALLGPDQVLGTPYDPRAIFQRVPAESSIDDLDGPIDSL